jgi:hypothetical protein
LAILSVEKIDLGGRGGLCESMNREREKSEDTEGDQTVFHDFMLPSKTYSNINFNSNFCRETGTVK